MSNSPANVGGITVPIDAGGITVPVDVKSAPRILLGVAPGLPAPANTFRFNYPQDAVEADDGSIYVSETQSHVIRVIKNGQVELFAGTLSSGYNGDGNRLAVTLSSPTALSIHDGKLVFSDTGNYLIRTIDLKTGQLQTIAGVPGKIGWPGTAAAIGETNIGYSVWLGYDTAGTLWAAMSVNNEQPRLYRLPVGYTSWDRYALPAYIPSDVIKTVRIADGVGVDLLVHTDFFRLSTYSASSRKLSTVYGGGIYFDESTSTTFIGDHTSVLVLDRDGATQEVLPVAFANIVSIKKSKLDGMLVVDSDQGRIYRLSAKGEVLWSTGGDADGLGVVVGLAQKDGDVLALDNIRPAVIAVGSTGPARRLAGNGVLRWADIEVDALNTGFYYPSAVAVDSVGNIYIAEQHRIMRVDAKTNKISLYCGYETLGNVYDTGCNAARFQSIRGLAFDRNDNLYVADTYNNQIKRVDSGGAMVRLVAGNGFGRDSFELMPSFDVAAIASPLNHPHAVQVAPSGDILIADSWNNAVYRLFEGRLQLFAGTPGRASHVADGASPYQGQGEYSGDGGMASKAKLDTPSGLAFCPNGDVLIADEFNFAVRRVNGNGLISTVLGGQNGYSADGRRAGYIHAVTCDATGFYAADVGNALVYRVDMR